MSDEPNTPPDGQDAGESTPPPMEEAAPPAAPEVPAAAPTWAPPDRPAGPPPAEPTTSHPTAQWPAPPAYPSAPPAYPSAPPGYPPAAPAGPPTGPPAGPPGWGPPPGSQQYPPQQYAPGQFPPQQYPPQQYPPGQYAQGDPQPGAAAEPAKSRGPLIAVLAVLGLVVVGVAVALALILPGGDDPDLTVTECRFDAGGEVSARVQLRNNDDSRGSWDIEVRFEGTDGDAGTTGRGSLDVAGGDIGSVTVEGADPIEDEAVTAIDCNAVATPR